MKTMRIGSFIINLSAMYDINCIKCKEGTIIRVEYSHSIKEYLVPGFFVPEMVATAIQRGINSEGSNRNLDSFDLMVKLQALDRIYGGVRVDETENES